MASRPQESNKVSLPDNYRVLHQFLQKNAWIEHLEGTSPETILDLIHLRRNDPLLPKLAMHISAFLSYYQVKLGNDYYLRRLIGTRPW